MRSTTTSTDPLNQPRASLSSIESHRLLKSSSARVTDVIVIPLGSGTKGESKLIRSARDACPCWRSALDTRDRCRHTKSSKILFFVFAPSCSIPLACNGFKSRFSSGATSNSCRLAARVSSPAVNEFGKGSGADADTRLSDSRFHCWEFPVRSDKSRSRNFGAGIGVSYASYLSLLAESDWLHDSVVGGTVGCDSAAKKSGS